MLRDAEIEAYLRDLADPVFDVAGLDVPSIRIFMVRDDTLNAFVAGGQNLFLNSGLMVRTETPDQLRGVIAHETGHIAGGHLSRGQVAMEHAGTQAILGALLGAAAAVAGAPQVGAAMMMGGLTAAQSGFLSFSRAQEQAADQSAVTFLGRLDESPRGLYEFFGILDQQNLRISGRSNPWLQTHPLTTTRMDFLENQIERSPFKNVSITGPLVMQHQRMVAKLDAFLTDPQLAYGHWSKDRSVPGRYASAIALYRIPRLDDALKEIRSLIQEYPNDPFFHELEGQMLYENGRARDAVGPYRKALALLPGNALLKLGLAKTMIDETDPKLLEQARQQLVDATVAEPENAEARRLLATVEGKLGREDAATLAMAEYNMTIRRYDDARRYAIRASQLIQPGNPLFLKLQDLQSAIDALPPDARNPQRRRSLDAPADHTTDQE